MNSIPAKLKSTPDYFEGDRVRIHGLRAGEDTGTVTYALRTDRGHSVTVRLDSNKTTVTVAARLLTKIETLFGSETANA